MVFLVRIFLLVVNPPVCVMCGCRFKVVILVLHTSFNNQLSLRLSILKNPVCVTVFCLLTFLVICNLRINHFINLKKFSLTIVSLDFHFLIFL